MDTASGNKSRRRLTQSNDPIGPRPVRERAADVWPPMRKLAPPKMPPSAPPNSLATSTMWSRDASSIGGRSSMASLKARFLPDTPASGDSGSAHTAQPLEDDWVPSYQRFNSPAAVGKATPAANGRKAPTPAGRFPDSLPSTYASAMSTLAALSAGLPPQPLAPAQLKPQPKPQQARAVTRARAALRSRPAAMQHLGTQHVMSDKPEMFPSLHYSSGDSSGHGSSGTSDRPGLRGGRRGSSDSEVARGPLRNYSSDTEVLPFDEFGCAPAVSEGPQR